MAISWQLTFRRLRTESATETAERNRVGHGANCRADGFSSAQIWEGQQQYNTIRPSFTTACCLFSSLSHLVALLRIMFAWVVNLSFVLVHLYWLVTISRHIRALLSAVVNAMSALLAEVDQQREEDERLRNDQRQQVIFYKLIFIIHTKFVYKHFISFIFWP